MRVGLVALSAGVLLTGRAKCLAAVLKAVMPEAITPIAPCESAQIWIGGMLLVPEETSLVVAGAWNPAILTPDWVLKHGLERESSARIQAFFPAGIGGLFEYPRFQLESDFSFMVRPDALVVTPVEVTDVNLQLTENAVGRIVTILKYTPVAGVGHNFEFRDSHPNIAYLEAFTAARQDITECINAEWRPAATTLSTSFLKDDGRVVVNIVRNFDAGVLSVKFNFHHPVGSIDDIMNILHGKGGYARMTDNLKLAKTLITNIYGECE